MSRLSYKLYYQRNLPHFQPFGATLFITFRLAGSLPKEVMLRLEEEARNKEDEINLIADPKKQKQAAVLAQKQLFRKWDAVLDAAKQSARWLANPNVASMICEALHYRDQRVFSLDAYCVMPNHIHLVCTPLEKEESSNPISEIMHSLKGYTGYQANKLVGRQGPFWQHESYDHVVRDNDELLGVVNYVLENPRRAGLPTKWTYVRDGIL